MDKDFYSIFEGLNSAQKEAVEQYEGPALIIAGAGSGKTRVLTNRIANILNHGHDPGGVLALTFTNKASGEMKERIAAIVGWKKARYIWMGTFHSVFLKFLKEDAHLLGYPENFTIFDTSASRSAIRACIKELSLDEKIYKPAELHSKISFAKNNLFTAASYSVNPIISQRDAVSRRPKTAEVFALYEKKCKLSGAMDFDDILLNTNILLRDYPEVLEKYRRRFSFILVDEYQDTNYSQYLIIKKLASEHRNICVVGDDAQSIYAFRGAKIENILNFRKDYPDAAEFRLEQNYRSTQTIVNAANSLIAKNSLQLKKDCFSEAEAGDKIELVKAFTEQEEAFMVANSIASKIYSSKCKNSDFAVLYRTNAQSRAVEEALRKRSIPYKIFGGYSFFDREEIKDAMSYFRLVVNPRDNEAFRRVIKVPSKGIGDTTIARIQAASSANDLSFWEAIESGHLDTFGITGSIQSKLRSFFDMINELHGRSHSENAYDIAAEILVRSGYLTELKNDNSLEGQSKVDNIEELLNSIKTYSEEIAEQFNLEHEAEELEYDGIVLLSEFMDNITLMSSVDESGEEGEEADYVSLMTVHSSKGLEYKHIYIIGMEENLFPSLNSLGAEQEVEEERRLFYVAITRAQKSVTLSYSHSRMKWGNHVNNPPSRFLKEIDQKYLSRPVEREIESAPVERFGERRRLPERERYGERDSYSSVQISKPVFQSAPVRPPDPDFRADPVESLKEGLKIEHDRFGFGKILEIDGVGAGAKAIVDFDAGGRKTLLLKFAKLRIINNM
jgi:DNA helicase-2/ATP-dependent DNA helicase PcrA